MTLFQANTMDKMHVRNELLPGVFVLQCSCFHDHRGDFTKLFNSDSLLDQGITFSPAETFLTRSKANVLRGMHFQVGTAAQDKLVCCLKGSVLDVIVDIRPDSPIFNRPLSIQLSQSEPIALLIGKGYAHGFLALEDDNWLMYHTSTVHEPSLDRGVLWSSIDFDWPTQDPIISVRDTRHPPISEHV